MKVIEYHERECCRYDDLVPLLGTEEDIIKDVRALYSPEECQYRICVHCHSVHEYHRYMDAAGSMDWEYRKVET